MLHHHKGGRRLPDKLREKWQNPLSILGKTGLRPGDKFMDIGCGDGYFAIPAAKIVGDKGMVYGVDINGDVIEELKRKAEAEKLTNIELMVAEAETTVFFEGCADIVFFGIDLHDFRDPAAVLENARLMLKPNGKLVDLDWNKVRTFFGPAYEIRFSEAKSKRLIEAAGFKIEATKKIKPYNYMLIARPA